MIVGVFNLGETTAPAANTKIHTKIQLSKNYYVFS